MAIRPKLVGGNEAVIFQKLGNKLFGAYKAYDEWWPIVWDPRTGAYTDKPTALDLVYGTVSRKKKSNKGEEEG